MLVTHEGLIGLKGLSLGRGGPAAAVGDATVVVVVVGVIDAFTILLLLAAAVAAGADVDDVDDVDAAAAASGTADAAASEDGDVGSAPAVAPFGAGKPKRVEAVDFRATACAGGDAACGVEAAEVPAACSCSSSFLCSSS